MGNDACLRVWTGRLGACHTFTRVPCCQPLLLCVARLPRHFYAAVAWLTNHCLSTVMMSVHCPSVPSTILLNLHFFAVNNEQRVSIGASRPSLTPPPRQHPGLSRKRLSRSDQLELATRSVRV